MKSILLVEDDRIISTIYRNKFTTAGFQVSVAEDGETAIALLKKSLPRLVLLDLMLPGINGVEVIKFIRAQPGGAEVAIFVFSNTYVSSLVKLAWEAGANKCLAKHASTPKHILELAETALAPPIKEPSAPLAASSPPPSPRSEVLVDDLRTSLSNSVPQIVTSLRLQLQNLAKAGPAEQQQHMQELYRKLHSLTGNAGLAGFAHAAQLCSAIEALLKELDAKPDKVTPSSLRTIAQAIDLLPGLFGPDHAKTKSLSSSIILVLDDEKFSRQAVMSALGKVNLRGLALETSGAAIEAARENTFDLMFLDVELPDIKGFDLCTKLRGSPKNKATSVVFVTSLTDFETRKQSILSGGSDVIAKPFLLLELGLKAVTYLLKQRDERPAATDGPEIPNPALS